MFRILLLLLFPLAAGTAGVQLNPLTDKHPGSPDAPEGTLPGPESSAGPADVVSAAAASVGEGHRVGLMRDDDGAWRCP